MRKGKPLNSGLLLLAAVTASFFSTFAVQAATGLDADADGLADETERIVYFTDPKKSDTDGDGFGDWLELQHGFSPRHGGGVRLLDVDSDADGLNDGWELALIAGLMNPDTDSDGFSDGVEVKGGFSPVSVSTEKPEKRIEVDVSAARLTYYFYGRPLDSFLVSPGKTSTPTPRGEFEVMQKLPSVRYVGPGYDYPNTKWNLLFARQKYGYYIHGAYWHARWGSGVSGGCVNVPYDKMERLYGWAEVGTKVVVHD
jgi:hypothetical protein